MTPVLVIDPDETEGAFALAAGAIGALPVPGAGARFWPRVNGRAVIPPGMPAGGYATRDAALRAACGHQASARLYLEATGAA